MVIRDEARPDWVRLDVADHTGLLASVRIPRFLLVRYARDLLDVAVRYERQCRL